MQSTDELNFWQHRWQTKETTWDLAGAHPKLMRLLALAGFEGHDSIVQKHIFVPACGTAHDGAAMAKVGAKVVAEDVIPSAIDAARAIYTDVNLHLRVGDSLVTAASDTGKFDCVFDRAALCAMQPRLRAAFLHACMEKLRPGGKFISILFGKINEPLPPGGGPPFAITPVEFVDLLGSHGDLLAVEEHPWQGQNSRIASEVLIVARKN